MNKVKLAIVGTGSGAQIMYGSILRLLEFGQPLAYVDPNPKAIEGMQAIFRVEETYNDFSGFLTESDAEAVVLCTPVFVHAEQTRLAARAGKHVLCEKPMARTIEECQQMIDDCSEHGVKLMVGHTKRFDKSVRYAKLMVDEGELGRVYQVLIDWTWYEPPASRGWRDELRTFGGLGQDIGAHTLDLTRWLLGDITEVSGEIAMVRDIGQVEDKAIYLARHASGGISVHVIGASNRPCRESYLIEGTGGSLHLENTGPHHNFMSPEPFRITLHREGKSTQDVTIYNDYVLERELQQHYRYKVEIDHFCECILKDEQPLVSGEDGLRAVEAVNAAYLSSWKRRKVSLPLESSPNLEQLFQDLYDTRHRRWIGSNLR